MKQKVKGVDVESISRVRLRGKYFTRIKYFKKEETQKSLRLVVSIAYDQPSGKQLDFEFSITEPLSSDLASQKKGLREKALNAITFYFNKGVANLVEGLISSGFEVIDGSINEVEASVRGRQEKRLESALRRASKTNARFVSG